MQPIRAESSVGQQVTRATVAADNSGEPEAGLEVLGLIALKGKVVTADALQCNRCPVAAIAEGDPAQTAPNDKT